MNRTHRIVWSESRKAFIVTGENAKAKGKPSTTRKAIASAVVMALAALAAEPAMAAACPAAVAGTISVASAVTGLCTPATGVSLIVSSTGSISGGVAANSTSFTGISIAAGGAITGAGTGISLSSVAVITGALANSGTITGASHYGIYATSSTIGSLTNSGAIRGGSTGINLSHSTITGALANRGTITGTAAVGINIITSSTISSLTNGSTISGHTGVKLNASTITGALSNSGTITGTSADGILVTGASTIGSLTNSGTITGGIYSVYVSSNSTLANLYLAGSSARLVGDVYAPNTAVSVTGTFTGTNAFNVNSFNVASGGVFNLGPDSTVSGGLTTNGVSVGAGGFNNAGTLAIASGVTGKITGAYTQTSTTSGTGLSIGVASQSYYGQLNITGAATFSGAGLIYIKVASPSTLLSGTSLSGYILTATGGITAGSGLTVKSNSTADIFTATIVGNKIILNYVAATTTTSTSSSTFLTAVSGAGNSQSAGAASVLDALLGGQPLTLTTVIGPNANMYAMLVKLASSSNISLAISSTLPSPSTTQATKSILNSVKGIVDVRLSGLSSGEDFVTNGNAWIKPIGSWGNQNDTSTVSGYKSKTFGAAFGADGDLSPKSRIGVALALTRSTVNNNLGTQSAGIDSYQAVLYGTRALDEQSTVLNWQGDYGINQNSSSRAISFMSTTAASSYASNSIHVGSSVGRSYHWSEQTSITPSIRADYTTLHNNGYTESGADVLNLVVDSSTSSEFILGLDGNVAHKVSESTNLSANLGVGYDTMAQHASITAAYQGGGAAFTTQGLDPARTMLRGGVGMSVKASKTVDITGRYDVEARSGFTGQTGSVKFNMMF